MQLLIRIDEKRDAGRVVFVVVVFVYSDFENGIVVFVEQILVTVGILLNRFSLLSCLPITVTSLFIEWNACAIQYASLPSPKIAMLVFSLISIWLSISNAAAKGSV